MLLEKIKKHAGKLSFFAINSLLVFSGTMYIRQENLKASLNKMSEQKTASLEPAEAPASVPDTKITQDNIAAIRQEKINSIANNPAVVTKKTTVTTTKTVPSTTKKTSSSSKSTKSVATASAPAPTPTPTPTPVSKPAPAPAPAKTTKTS